MAKDDIDFSLSADMQTDSIVAENGLRHNYSQTHKDKTTKKSCSEQAARDLRPVRMALHFRIHTCIVYQIMHDSTKIKN